MTGRRASTPLSTGTVPLALAILPIFALYLPKALVIVLAVVACGRGAECLRARHCPSLGVALVAALVAAWALLSALWAPVAVPAITGSAGWLGVTAIAVLLHDAAVALPPVQRRRAVAIFAASATFAAVLLALEGAWGYALAARLHGYDASDPFSLELASRSLNRGASFLAVLCPFIALAAVPRGWRVLLVLALAVVMLGTVLRGKEATLLGLMVAGLAALAAWRRPGPTRRGLVAAMVAVTLAAPLAARLSPPPERMWEQWPNVSQSVLHRLFIWQFTADRIAERPLAGWGMNAAKFIPGGNDDRVITNRNDHTTSWRPLPLHPHNMVLQWWLELGAIGALLMTVVAVGLLGGLGRLGRPGAATAATAFAAGALVVSLVSFGAWQSWWLATLMTGLWLARLADDGEAPACFPSA